MLEGLKPERVFYYFEKITKIPRESGNEQAISDFLYKTAKELGLEVKQDEANNIIIKKPAAPEYEDHESVIIQGHMDMVAEKAIGVEHDFLKDAIPLVVEDDWVKTKGTTLGADDGIAIAIGLAILEDKSAKHPPLELVVTTNEETTMVGARALKKEDVNGKKLLNIDAEEEGILLSGCAGGHNIIGTMDIEYLPNPMKYTYELRISNMLGGHSGMEIHQKRGNSIKFALEALEFILGEIPHKLISIDGGTKHNAIPRDAILKFSTNEEKFNVVFDELIARYPLDKDMLINLNQTANADSVLSDKCQSNLEGFIKDIPHGVYSMMQEYPDIVECSNNLAILSTSNNKVIVTISLRSANPVSFDAHTSNVINVYKKYGFNVETQDYYKPWVFAKESKLRDLAVNTFNKLFGKEMKVQIVHAALEPAVFTDTFPELEMISIGPTMKDVHSPMERLSISSTERTYKFIRKLLEEL